MAYRVPVTVEPALFLFMFSTFMSYPLMYQLVYQTVCGNCSSSTNATSNNSHNNSSSLHACPHTPSDVQTRVEDETSSWILYINLANSIPSIAAALAFGAWSDKVGRKLVISLPAIGLSLNAGFVLLFWYLHLPLTVLFAGQIISGFLGGFATFNMGVFAYMSDVTSPASRTTRIGILESMIFLGGMLGDLIGGLWVKHGNFGPAFWCIFVAGAVVLLYVNIVIRESRIVPSLPDNSHKCRTFFRCINLVKAASLFVQSRRPYWPLVLGVSVFVLASLNFAGIIDVVVLYVFDWPLCFSSDRLGFFLAAKMGMNGIANLFLLPLLKYAGLSDFAIINLGLVFGAASLILMGLAYHAWMLYLVPVIGALRGSVVPSLRSLMSKMVAENDNGALFSAIACIEVVCSLLATVIFNNMYPSTRHLVTPHGFCFFFMSGVLMIALTVSFVLQRGWYASGGDRQPHGGQTHSTNDADADSESKQLINE